MPARPSDLTPADNGPTFTPVRRARRRRYVLPGHWQHVSARTQNGRFAFENFNPEFVARVWGYVGIANRRYGVNLCVFVLMANHFHAMLQARKSRRVSLWCQYVKSNLARLTHEFHGTKGTVWDGPYRHTNLLNDRAEQKEFLYICSHGVKEKIISHPAAWPGPNCITALLEGTHMEGLWLDKPAFRAAQNLNPTAPKSSFLHRIPVELTPLSAGHRSPERWRQMCHDTINTVLAMHSTPDLPEAYRSHRDFTHVPETTKTSLARCFDAAGDRALVREAQEARRNAVDASVFAHQRMVERGLDTLDAPHGTQWTACIAEALNEPFAEADLPSQVGGKAWMQASA